MCISTVNKKIPTFMHAVLTAADTRDNQEKIKVFKSMQKKL